MLKTTNDIVTDICAAINTAAERELALAALRYGLTVAQQDEIMAAVDDLMEDYGVAHYIARTQIERLNLNFQKGN